MSMLPPWPGWDGLHPLVIHFPVALLLVVPIFVALVVWRPSGSAFGISALVLLALGTIGAFVAVETGEAAAELATRSPLVNAALERHSDLAETARNVFAFLTLLYAALTVLPLGLKSLARPAYVRVANLVFLVLLLSANALLANVAHQGGILVHKLGVTAVVAGPAPAANAEPRAGEDEEAREQGRQR